MANTNYRALCQEIFGTDDEAQIRKYAAAWQKQHANHGGRKKNFSQQDLVKMKAMMERGVKLQEISRRFHVSRQCVSQYLNRRPNKNYTMRIDYKLGRQVCTVIYVNFEKGEIVIQNRTEDILNRAFGANTAPTWQDFEQFLVSRCFPENRGYAKQILQNLGIGSYDPLAIAEATSGKTAEDNMYLIFRVYPKEDATYGAD